MMLDDFFKDNLKIALAFSGGVDSSFLLYKAVQLKVDVTAYFVKSEFQPAFEFDDAKRLCSELGAKFKVINLNVLSDSDVQANGNRRCYFCKKKIFSAIQNEAFKDGYRILIDGTNASDDVNNRPGFAALQEMEVLSPLRICNLTKDEIRKLSKEAGIFTWNKPSYACLATRIPCGTKIELKDLEITEKSEDYLSGKGYSDFRVRKIGSTAKIQLNENQMEKFFAERQEIFIELKKYYENVVLDLETRL